jgi:hypothetical protein
MQLGANFPAGWNLSAASVPAVICVCSAAVNDLLSMGRPRQFKNR